MLLKSRRKIDRNTKLWNIVIKSAKSRPEHFDVKGKDLKYLSFLFNKTCFYILVFIEKLLSVPFHTASLPNRIWWSQHVLARGSEGTSGHWGGRKDWGVPGGWSSGYGPPCLSNHERPAAVYSRTCECFVKLVFLFLCCFGVLYVCLVFLSCRHSVLVFLLIYPFGV